MNRPLALLPLPLVLLLAAPASLAGEPARSSVETPAEAAARSGPADEESASANFGGGIWLVDEPDDDLVEPVPLGSKKDFEERGYEVIEDGDKVEVIVDREGKIYGDRNYQGIVPGLRDYFSAQRFAKLQSQDYVLWVGFQPMATVTRLFWQLTDPAPRFEVTRIDDRTIEVFFPGGRITKKNNRRPIWTQKFGGAVDSIVGRSVRGGARYTVKLRANSPHLYRFEAPFLFVDFERQ